MSSVYVVCWIFLQTFQTYFCIPANNVDPDQTDPRGAVWSGSTLFAKMTFKITSRWQSRRQLLWLAESCGIHTLVQSVFLPWCEFPNMNLTLKAPITTIVVCFVFCRLLYVIVPNSVDPDQARSSLIWVHTVSLYAKCKFEKFARRCSRRHKQTTFSDADLLGTLRAKTCKRTCRLMKSSMAWLLGKIIK